MAAEIQSVMSTDNAEETKVTCCSLCPENGDNSAAGYYCVDCEIYLCNKCLKCHNKIPAAKSHQVNDVENGVQDEKTKSKVQMEEGAAGGLLSCQLHHGKIMDSFCLDHRNFCCKTCTAVKHRSCKTEMVAVLAKDYKSSNDMNNCKEALTNIITDLNQAVEEKTENMKSIDQDKIQMMESVDKYEEELVKQIKSVAETSRKEIRDKCITTKKLLNADVDALRTAIDTATVCADKLEAIDEEQLFINVQSGFSFVKESDEFLQPMLSDIRKIKVSFTVEEEMKTLVEGKESFGEICEQRIIEGFVATSYSKITVDDYPYEKCRIFDMCLLDPDNIILTETDTNKIERYDADFILKESIDVLSFPIAICTVDANEIAVRSFGKGQVQLISVQESMQINSAFFVGTGGYGMAYDTSNDEFFVCANSEIRVFNKTGIRLRIIAKACNGDQIFKNCRQITIDVERKYLYVTDENKGLILLDTRGNVKSVMLGKELGIKGPWAVCKLPGNILVLSGKSPNMVYQLDKQYKKHTILQDKAENLPVIYSMVYDHSRERLIISGDSGIIHIYSLSASYFT